ncbi:hypothetical protein MCUN1_001284 [Malassezia cuniculi]|uniref:Cytochrome c oxidase assembly protein COX20, mitochondrial n=1 Tax=Malassezia cuniculi TaxID=948313 RepID=A0AAF0EPG7_9BASI|nr:hypothetical protein MCUN1_001284 [Malassezia cuniculi]
MADLSQLHTGTVQPKPALADALTRIPLFEDLKRLPQIPCARSSLLCGIASGAAIGSVQLLMRRADQAHMQELVAKFNEKHNRQV